MSGKKCLVFCLVLIAVSSLVFGNANTCRAEVSGFATYMWLPGGATIVSNVCLGQDAYMFLVEDGLDPIKNLAIKQKRPCVDADFQIFAQGPPPSGIDIATLGASRTGTVQYQLEVTYETVTDDNGVKITHPPTNLATSVTFVLFTISG